MTVVNSCVSVIPVCGFCVDDDESGWLVWGDVPVGDVSAVDELEVDVDDPESLLSATGEIGCPFL